MEVPHISFPSNYNLFHRELVFEEFYLHETVSPS